MFKMPFGRVATQSGHFRRPEARWSKWNLRKREKKQDVAVTRPSVVIPFVESFRDSSQDHEKIQCTLCYETMGYSQE